VPDTSGAKGPIMDPRYGSMSEHRVSMLGSSLRRTEDPEQSRDPRIRELVEALRSVDYAPAPDPDFRSELRAQLVAVAPRIIAESATDTEAASTKTRSAAPATGRAARSLNSQLQRRRFVRPLALASGVAAAFLMLFGGAVWMSQKSLPGDSLYGLKRASENVRLSLSSGGTDRGHEYLSLAQTRVEEARALLRRDSASASGAGPLAGGLSPHVANQIADNLASADSDLRHGADLLNTQAVRSESQSPISVITGWAPGQLGRLKDLAVALPQGSLQNRTTSSWTLTNSALTRARILAPAVATGCASTSKTDTLGPVPTCARTGPAPSSGSSKAPGSARAPGSRPAGTGTANIAPRTHKPGTTGSPARSAARSSTTSPAPTRPSLPALLPGKGPVSIGSCGISVSLGPIGVGLGGCPSHS
jgi:uncharacterized protein DUF5667